MDDKPNIIAAGFKTGYRRYQETGDPSRNLLPDCPFPLRTPERSLWLQAWAAGKETAREHRADADQTIEIMIRNETGER